MTTDPDFHDNTEARRYELKADGGVAVATYNLVDGGVLISETLVPEALEGRGIASRLAKLVLEDIQARGLKILPVCPFFSGWLKKHPEWAESVHPTYRAIIGI